MDDTSSETRFLPSGNAPKKTPNVSGGWVAMVLSGLLAAVIFLAITARANTNYAVVVVGERVAAGERVNSGAFSKAEVDVGKNQLKRLVPYNQRDDFNNWVATASLEPGELLNLSSLAPPSASAGLRTMSIPADRSRAVAGAIRPGDRIDLIDEKALGGPAVVVTNLPVVSTSTGGEGGLTGGGSEVQITVNVTQADAVLIAGVLLNEKFDVVRSTGADVVTPGLGTSGATPGGSAIPTTAAPRR